MHTVVNAVNSYVCNRIAACGNNASEWRLQASQKRNVIQ
jgi:hypothetical protein